MKFLYLGHQSATLNYTLRLEYMNMEDYTIYTIAEYVDFITEWLKIIKLKYFVVSGAF